jgi:hypothetical protein
MKKLNLFLLIFAFSLLKANAQAVYTTEVNSQGSSITATYKCLKSDLPIRMSPGITLITPYFEGNLWDEDSKGAVEYACKLMSERLLTACPIRIKVVRSSSQNIPYVRTKVNSSPNYSYVFNISNSVEYEGSNIKVHNAVSYI